MFADDSGARDSFINVNAEEKVPFLILGWVWRWQRFSGEIRSSELRCLSMAHSSLISGCR